MSESDKIEKKPYDEQTLAKVLEAAYVLQEHHRQLQQAAELQSGVPQADVRAHIPAPTPAPFTPPASGTAAAKDDYAAILAQIVEIQHQIQTRHLGMEASISLIAQRVLEITKAAGAAIGILDGRMLRYRAAAGKMALPVGAEISMEKALCAASLRVGDVIRCADVNPDFLIDANECHRRGIQSLIAVPIYLNGKTAGALEVYYPNTHAFAEPDVHTCQLMAGLVTEALARNEELTLKKSAVSERSATVDSLERLQPNLAALAASVARPPAPPIAASVAHPAVPPIAPAAAAFVAPATASFHCRKCGHELVGEEQFCGQCGTPRHSDYERPTMQSKVASMIYMQEVARKIAAGAGHDEHSSLGATADVHSGQTFPPHSGVEEHAAENDGEDDLPELFHLPEVSPDHAEGVAHSGATGVEAHATDTIERSADLEISAEDVPWDEESPPVETALARSTHAHWNSAEAARHFWEQVAKSRGSGAFRRFISARRGQVYLALALILVAAVIRWGIWSNHPVAATGKSPTVAAHRRPEADLPLFDRILINLGLADPPDAPEYKGNPDTQVWIDLHSGLYYCPGADLYGKTPKGKYSAQRDAQLDQFEPALRKACD